MSVEWGKKFVSYEETATGVTAVFEDGTRATGELLAGADGARSRVRAQRCPELQLECLPVAVVAASLVATPTMRAKVPRVADLVASSYIVRALAPGGHTLLVMDYEDEGDIASAGETETTTTKLLWAYSFPVNSVAPPTWSSEPTTLKQVHPKLHNINLHNVTLSLISRNPRERMSAVQNSLLSITFLSLISQNLSLMQTTKEVNLQPCICAVCQWYRIAPCFNGTAFRFRELVTRLFFQGQALMK